MKEKNKKLWLQLYSIVDKILKLEEHIVRLNAKINLLDDGDSKIDKLINRLNKDKQKIASAFNS